MACEQYGTALLCVLAATYLINYNIQCPLDIATLDIAAALPIATSNPVTDLHHSINYNFVYNDQRFQPFCTK